MIITNQQQLWLQQYLRSVLTYRETYEEVYDHLLAALESRPADQFFESSVITVIEADFGGTNGLMRLENNCRNGVVSDVRSQYRQYFSNCLKYPEIIGIGIAAIMVYYIANYIKFGFVFIYCLIFITIMIPVFLLSVRYLKLGYKFMDTKTSLKDDVFKKMAFKPFQYMVYLFSDYIRTILK